MAYQSVRKVRFHLEVSLAEHLEPGAQQHPETMSVFIVNAAGQVRHRGLFVIAEHVS